MTLEVSVATGLRDFDLDVSFTVEKGERDSADGRERVWQDNGA